ncbi:MAG TPA: hypothetical protein DCL61_20530 [Cyanobacteria bacterium UBA12227]|nr:hypothetical protein [Cyanobacteria bacterium UBA12227]HAX90077.1 hypothetical protein [Cyanobacteria bacterium UBA11370]HBY76558.1 hypothetical protein [Cyanobacteria bacterium UBA11148]
MRWFTPKKISDNELGEYLPDDEAQLQEGYEPIQAENDAEAQEKCREVASEYGGVQANAEPTDRKNEYDCRFKFWG